LMQRHSLLVDAVQAKTRRGKKIAVDDLQLF